MSKHKRTWAEKTAVITGSGSGIGRAIAITLARKSVTLHLIDLRQERITTLIEELSAETGIDNRKIHGHTVDVTKPEDLNQLASTIQSKVDILINCAGILHQGKIATAAHKDLHQVLDVNLWGAIYSIKALLPLMKQHQIKDQRHTSHIINIASIAGLIGAPEMSIYNASKSALLSLTESLSIELAPDNIHVAAVCPGSVRSNLGRDGRFSSESTAAHLLRSSIRNGAEPERVARDIVQVVERAASFKLSCVELHWQLLWLCKRIFPSSYSKLAIALYHQVLDNRCLASLLSIKPNAKSSITSSARQ